MITGYIRKHSAVILLLVPVLVLIPARCQGLPGDLIYSTYLGGNGEDHGYGIAVDPAGSVFVTGDTFSSDFPTGTGAYQSSLRGSTDFFVSKINPAGSGLLYSTYCGGSRGDYASGITVDDAGNAYITGHTYSMDFPSTPGAFQTMYNGLEDIFIFKLNPGGSAPVFSTYIGGTDWDAADSISIDIMRNVYITGRTESLDFPTTGSAFDKIHNGNSDAIVLKLRADGSALIYSTYLGGADWDAGTDLALNSAGNAFIVGHTESSDFPVSAAAFDRTFNGLTDLFITQLSTDGSGIVFSSYLGGRGADDWFAGLVLDLTNNAHITGRTTSPDFPVTAGAFDTTHNGDYDAFVSKLSSDGSALIYSTFIGGVFWDEGQDITIDDRGNVYVTGQTGSYNYPFTAHAYDTSFNGLSDVFITMLNDDGSSLRYSTFLGGSDWDSGTSITMDNSQNVYVTGSTFSPDFPTSTGVFDPTYNSDWDIFVSKFDMSSSIVSFHNPGTYAVLIGFIVIIGLVIDTEQKSR